MSEAFLPDVSLGGRAEQSSTMPRLSPRAFQHHRRASDASIATAPHSDLSKDGHEQTPVKAASDGRSGDSERSLKAPTGLGLKTFASPAASSPSSTGVLAPTNTRRIGSRFCIELVKGLFDNGV